MQHNSPGAARGGPVVLLSVKVTPCFVGITYASKFMLLRSRLLNANVAFVSLSVCQLQTLCGGGRDSN